MPSHQERREPLPKGYQFGDAGPKLTRMYDHDFSSEAYRIGETIRIPLRRDVSRLLRDHRFTANVIEGEHFASDAERHGIIEGERTT